MKKLKNIIALIGIVFLPFGLMVWYRTHQSSGFASLELIVYPLLFGGGSILILYIIKKYFLKESLAEFNSGKGYLIKDWLWALALTAIYFVLFYVERLTLSDILTFKSNMELLGLMLDMREKPILIILWFFPVLWIGIALYEELIRVFILTSLWKYSTSMVGAIVVMLITSLIIGFAHWSQGSYGIVTIAIKSMVACIFFYKYRRLMPLVISHVLYDGIQVAMLLITYPH
ncbi:MAG: CPBP family intramembrane metalloprotease [Salinivirgaceae bacterium]|nr:CPBP family intramembrane metalloprotease [Salinivirgaceae bacterium]